MSHLDAVERLMTLVNELSAENEALRARVQELEKALAELLVSLMPMPPYETGKTAQDAWSNKRMNAEERARAALTPTDAKERT